MKTTSPNLNWIFCSDVQAAVNKFISNKFPGIHVITAESLELMGQEDLRIILQWLLNESPVSDMP